MYVLYVRQNFPKYSTTLQVVIILKDIALYRININEIPGELSHKKTIIILVHNWKWHVVFASEKITLVMASHKSCLLLWSGFIIGVYIINRTLHARLEIWNFSSYVEKYFTSKCSKLVKFFSTLEEKFDISVQPCNILYIIHICEKVKVVLNPFCRLKTPEKVLLR